MAWFGRKKLVCYFCGQEQAGSKGKAAVNRFHCSHCGSANALDAKGQPLQDDAQTFSLMSNAALPSNKQSFKRRATTAGLARLDPGFQFCHQCTTNQTLSTHLLAHYYDDEDMTPEALEARLPAYRASLAQRYPIVCDACAVQANDILQKRNCMVKRELLAQSFSNSKPLFVQRDPRGTFKWRLQNRLWRFKGIAFLLLQAGQLLAYYSCYRDPLGIRKMAFQCGATTHRLLGASLASFPLSFFNPAWPAFALAKIRHKKARIKGFPLWLASQTIAFALKLGFAWSLLELNGDGRLKQLSLTCLVFTVLPLLAAFALLRIELPKPFYMPRSKAIVADPRPALTARPSIAPRLAQANFVHPVFGRITPLSDTPEPADASMDWQYNVDAQAGSILEQWEGEQHQQQQHTAGIEDNFSETLAFTDGPIFSKPEDGPTTPPSWKMF